MGLKPIGTGEKNAARTPELRKWIGLLEETNNHLISTVSKLEVQLDDIMSPAPPCDTEAKEEPYVPTLISVVRDITLSLRKTDEKLKEIQERLEI